MICLLNNQRVSLESGDELIKCFQVIVKKVPFGRIGEPALPFCQTFFVRQATSQRTLGDLRRKENVTQSRGVRRGMKGRLCEPGGSA